MKLPAGPAVKVVWSAEVIAAASSTVRVKGLVSGWSPLAAVMVSG